MLYCSGNGEENGGFAEFTRVRRESIPGGLGDWEGVSSGVGLWGGVDPFCIILVMYDPECWVGVCFLKNLGALRIFFGAPFEFVGVEGTVSVFDPVNFLLVIGAPKVVLFECHLLYRPLTSESCRFQIFSGLHRWLTACDLPAGFCISRHCGIPAGFSHPDLRRATACKALRPCSVFAESLLFCPLFVDPAITRPYWTSVFGKSGLRCHVWVTSFLNKIYETDYI